MFKVAPLIRLFVCCCTLGALPAHAQYGWHWQNPIPQGNSLRSIKMIDQFTATAVGGGDPVLRTTDGGQTWIRQKSGTTNVLYGISFTDRYAGTAVGNAGTIVHTDDGGQIWRPQTSNTTSNLRAVQFLTAFTGTAVGSHGTIMRTTDGGFTWLPQSSGTVQSLNGLSFDDLATGVVVGDSGLVLYTNDGGATWTRQFTGTVAHLLGVSIVGRDTIIAVGRNGVIIRSINAGVTWTQMVTGISSSLNAVTMFTSRIGTAVAYDGAVLRTTNGGTVWVRQGSKTTNVLYGVSFADENTGMIVGDYGTIARTTDGGTTWVTQTFGSTNTLYDVCFSSPDNGVAVGDSNLIVRTTDGGTNWKVMVSGKNSTLFATSFLNANTGWVVGSAGNIQRTTDSGKTWDKEPSTTTTTLLGVSFANPRVGLAVGRESLILRTSNSGTAWTRAPIPNSYPFYVTSPLYGVTMIDSMNAVAVGYDEVGHNGIVLRTTDGGTEWTNQPTGVLQYIYAASFIDVNTGMVCGAGGTVLYTNDAGATWQQQNTGTPINLFDIGMLDARHAFAVGDAGVILHTTDAGHTWVRQSSGTINFIAGLAVRGTHTATAVGFGGTILETTTSGHFSPLTISADDYDFGEVPVDTLRSATVSILNSSIQTVTVHPALSGEGVFSFSPDSLQLFPGQQKLLTVRFRPTQPGRHNGIIALNHAGAVETDSVGLEGVGVGSLASLSANAIDFGDVMISRNKTSSVTITNTGNAPLLIASILCADPRFAVAPFNGVLQPGEQKIVAVTFTPSDTGVVTAPLTIAHSGPGSTAVVQLRGRGILLDFILVTNALNFGQVHVDSSKTLKAFVVNTTSTQVAIDSIVSTDTHFVAQRVFGVAVHDTGKIGITFTLDTIGSVYAWIVIYHNFSTSPDSVRVVGGGTLDNTGVGDIASPVSSLLLSNYPNPFGAGASGSDATSIAFTLDRPASITLKIYSPLGDEIATIARGMYDGGEHHVSWSAAAQPAGIYFYRVSANGHTASGRMTVVK